MPNPGIPIRIRGVDYPSRSAAARALGVTPSTICNAIANGRLDEVGLGRNHWRQKAVEVDGKRYESVTAASITIGLPAGGFKTRTSIKKRAGQFEFTYKGHAVRIIQ